MIQNFTMAIRLPEKDDCGNPIKPYTESQIARAVRNNAPINAIVDVEEETSIVARIHDVFRRYFSGDDKGDPNPQFDDYFDAETAIDEIHDIVGNFYAKAKEESK